MRRIVDRLLTTDNEELLAFGPLLAFVLTIVVLGGVLK